VTLTDRDRKLLVFIVPAVVIAAYWFLLLSPMREEGSRLGDDLAKQEQKRDGLEAQVAQLGKARNDFATDYAAVVELGKAVPPSVDMPSLLVQLDKASKGTGIDFERIHAGDRLPAAGNAPSTGGTQAGTAAAAAGGEKAGTGAGRATEKANDTKAQQDSAANSQSDGGSGASTAGSSTATPAAGSPTPAPAAGDSGATSGAPGLDAVPLEFTFNGSFFDLADFFHRMKRFVRVANDQVDVRGRLMTIEGVDFKASNFPMLEAQVTAKVYLTPESQGTTAGATPAAPSPSQGAGQAASAPAPAPSAPPAAAVTR
jgi:hypothetical protein